MHLDYTTKVNFFDWQELGCLARALGFHNNLFYENIPAEYKRQPGVPVEALLHLVSAKDCFNKAVDRTSNIHTDQWNLAVIAKAINLVCHRLLSFADLRSVRVAYQAYASSDTKGMPLEERTLQRCLKLCGRMISPLKMMHRIKHMRQHFEEEDFIQLHEFLDLLRWCDVYENTYFATTKVHQAKDSNDLFSLTNFLTLLTHYDDRLTQSLDQKYLKQEWRFTKVKHISIHMPKDIPPVNSDLRKKQVSFHNKRYRHLRHQVSRSQHHVRSARAGYVRPRSTGARAPETVRPASVKPHTPATVSELANLVTTAAGRPMTSVSPSPTPPRPTDYTRARTVSPVTPSQLRATRTAIEALQFDIDTATTRYKIHLNDKLNVMLPGYRQTGI